MDRREHILTEFLVLRSQEGDAEAFERLVKLWQPRLYRHALRMTGRSDAAWDVLQEAWMAATKGLPRLRDPSLFRRWAYTIVTRHAVDWHRRRRRHPEAELPEDGLEDLAADAPGGDPNEEPVEVLRRALALLPGEKRALLSLRYFEGFDGTEMAEILGVPEGTVKSKLYAARQKLREIMERIRT